jgi:hypothetical protein
MVEKKIKKSYISVLRLTFSLMFLFFHMTQTETTRKPGKKRNIEKEGKKLLLLSYD